MTCIIKFVIIMQNCLTHSVKIVGFTIYRWLPRTIQLNIFLLFMCNIIFVYLLVYFIQAINLEINFIRVGLLHVRNELFVIRFIIGTYTYKKNTYFSNRVAIISVISYPVSMVSLNTLMNNDGNFIAEIRIHFLK